MAIEMKDYYRGIQSYCELVQAMIDGLNKFSNKDGFKIDMETFGTVADGVCFGCAATCLLQHLTGKELTPDLYDLYKEEGSESCCSHIDDLLPCHYSYDVYGAWFFSDAPSGLSRQDVRVIEQAIDKFRSGLAVDLLNLCKTNKKDKKRFFETFSKDLPFFLTSENYRSELARVASHLKKVMKTFELEWVIC